MIETIGKVSLDLGLYRGQDFYSEGAAEDELLEIVKNSTEKEWNHRIEERGKWSVLYHLSNLRGNIAEWLPLKKTDKVLEVGAGCGAVTGTLAKKAGKVDCIELSKKRSMINAYRNRECENLTIKVGNFEEIEETLEQTYDYIMLIGVFEYAEAYLSAEKPYEEFLYRLKKHLAPDGKLIIAIENQFGLKYFAGCKEDHTGGYFEGIEGYPEAKGVKTFSRKKLEGLLRAAGYQTEFFYPYPDYKLPISIYSEEYQPKKGELNLSCRNFDGDRMVAFDEIKAYDALIDDGMFPFYSNSFLVSASLKEEKSETVYVKYSNERSEKYSIRTEILKNQSGAYCVRKYPIGEEAGTHIEGIYKKYQLLKERYQDTKISINSCKIIPGGIEFEYLTGKTFEQELDEILVSKDYIALVNKMKEYVGLLKKTTVDGKFYMTEQFQQVFGKVSLPEGLDAGYLNNIDLIFTNIILKDGWNIIDYEWTFAFPIPIHYVIYRSIHYYIKSSKREDLTRLGLYQLFGMTEEEVKAYDQMEYFFQHYILGEYVPVSLLYDRIAGCAVDMRALAEKSLKSRLQVYFDRGEGFSEEDSFLISPMEDENGVTKLKIPLDGGIKNVRIDPASDSCIVKIRRLAAEGEIHSSCSFSVNGRQLGENIYMVENTDPQIVVFGLSEEDKYLYAELLIYRLPTELAEAVVKYDTENETLRQTVEYQKGQLEAVLNSRSWKITAPLRKNKETPQK